MNEEKKHIIAGLGMPQDCPGGTTGSSLGEECLGLAAAPSWPGVRSAVGSQYLI